MFILIRLLPLLVLYVLFFFFPFKTAMIGYVSACIVQLILYKVVIGKFSIPHFFYFLSALLFVGAALHFKHNTIFMYEISFLLLISAVYILYQSLTAKKGERYLMGVLLPTDKKLASLTYLNNLMSIVYLVLALANVAIIHYLSATYWINFRVFGVYVLLMFVSVVIGFGMAKSDEAQKTPS